MNCPNCGLSIRLLASYLAVERCPRCLARRHTAVPMYISLQPGGPPAEGDPGAAPPLGQRARPSRPPKD
jgi:hypothetical protein